MTMIKLGTANEIDKISHLSEEMKKSIQEDIKILDDNYGSIRDIDKDLGGYVVILDESKDILELNNAIKPSLNEAIFEYAKLVDGYLKALYMLSSDFGIIVYIRKSIAIKKIVL
jgi:hypothetical protein